MSEKQAIRLEAQTRTHEGKKVQQLREQGIVPAVVYGHGKDSHNIQLKLRDLDRAYKNAGENTLIDLVIDNDSPIRVLIHDVSHDAISDYIQHVDFYAVNMSEKIHAEVVLHFVGIAPAVKEAGGTLIKTKDLIAIKCLPQDLISEKDIDISSLKTFEDAIHVRDVDFPASVEVLDDSNEVLASVAPPRSEEELAELNQNVTEDISKVEGVADKTPEVAVDAKASETK